MCESVTALFICKLLEKLCLYVFVTLILGSLRNHDGDVKEQQKSNTQLV